MTSHVPVKPTLTPGKAWGLRRLADTQGHFAMVAIDQRPPIAQLVARARGVAPDAVGFADVARVKRWLAQGLAEHASAMLVDPNFAYPACVDLLRPDRGLLLTLEEHRYTETPQGRLSASIPDWSVEKIRRIGGDAVKVLAWYRPDAAPEVCAAQQAYVRDVGAQCREHDIPFIFELLVYPFPTGPDSLRDYVEDPGKLPHLVVDSVRTFADPAYGIDLFKLESPVPMRELSTASATDSTAQTWFDRLGDACGGLPWVMLSAGAPADVFEKVVRHACRAGASGFLAGRALWWDAASHFPDEEGVLDALRETAVPRLHRLTEIVRAEGRACWPGVDTTSMRIEGDFARSV